MADLFPDTVAPSAADDPRPDAPLADRLRPRSLAEVVGQEHLTGPDGAIGRMVAAGRLSSMILWGPPGTGKTSIARLLADAVGMRFVAISAVFSGVADLKKVFAEADKAAQAGVVGWIREQHVACAASQITGLLRKLGAGHRTEHRPLATSEPGIVKDVLRDVVVAHEPHPRRR